MDYTSITGSINGLDASGSTAPAVSITSSVTQGTFVTASVATGGKGEKGEKGDPGSNAPSDHTLLSNIGTNTHAQIDTAISASTSHIANTSNPHSVTKAQVGLGSVDNTSDVAKPVSTATQTALDTKSATSHSHDYPVDSVAGKTGAVTLVKADVGLANVDNTSDAAKPISTATQTALDGKQATITSGTTAQYYRGDKTFATLDKAAVGLANVDNTSDANKPVSTVQQTALNAKQDTITAGTTAQYYRGDKTFQTLDKAAVGLSNVDNTSDASKPVSTATQTALDAKLNTSGGTMSGALTLASDPTTALQAATKQYVDVQLVPPTPPAGYIRVPGNSKFGTSDFFVMKYQAKNDGANNAVSTAAGFPWVSITQRSAQDQARALGQGYHLITEPEWMTIATDALWQPSNWTSGTVGTGALYSGHNDNAPANALEATTDDNDGYFGTGNVAPSNQRRTLTLSNGEVIWDIAGNVWEWTDAWIQGSEQPNDAVDGFAWHQFTAITAWKGLQYANPTNRGWNSAQGLGQMYTDGTATNNTQYGFLRGAAWSGGGFAGAFTLYLSYTPTTASASIGFRVARSIV